jgi:hypothetical protein
MSETQVICQFVEGTLEDDVAMTALIAKRVYYATAPQGEPMPYILYQRLSGVDVQPSRLYRLGSKEQYVIKVVCDEDTAANLDAINDRMDALLHGFSGDVEGGHISSCVRTSPFELPYSEQGKTYYQRGGIYDIFAQQT